MRRIHVRGFTAAPSWVLILGRGLWCLAGSACYGSRATYAAHLAGGSVRRSGDGFRRGAGLRGGGEETRWSIGDRSAIPVRSLSQVARAVPGHSELRSVPTSPFAALVDDQGPGSARQLTSDAQLYLLQVPGEGVVDVRGVLGVGVVALVGRSLPASLEVAQPVLARRAERQPVRVQVDVVVDIEERIANVLLEVDADLDARRAPPGFGHASR